ncbi:MAG: serine/threonine protein kinase with repeat [Candidatus Solibacter sp.]|nr:serine/threonine protein kinase with repeat [Candidatus Solibacter sp.]
MEQGAEHDQRVMNLVAAAMRLPEDERSAFLERESRGDAELLAEARDSVEWEVRMGGFLREPLVTMPEMDRVFHAGQMVAGRFEIIREVGEGGMGVVYEAFDRKRNQRICIKTAKLGFRRALPPELEGALRVRHPNICMVNEIHTAQTPGGEVDFLTMEFLEGETLSRHLASHGRLSSEDALTVARQLCAALAEAHRSGIVHRDLKTGNIMVSRGAGGGLRAVITDFGLSGENSEFAGFGTARYMAPELWRGEKATKASDVYALGVVLYEMATGVGPGTIPAAPSSHAPGLGAQWDYLVMPCFAGDPAARPEAADLVVRAGRKPRSRVPAIAAAVFAGMAAIAAAIPAVRHAVMERLNPPSVRLVVLPLAGATERGGTREGALVEAAERMRRLGSARRTVAVIGPSDALGHGVRSAEDAGRVLGATHALATTLVRQEDEWKARSVIVDVKTKETVREFTGKYASLHLDDLAGALTGLVSAALHLDAPSRGEELNPAAGASYLAGMFLIRRDRRSYDDAIQMFELTERLDGRSPLPKAGMAEALIQKYQALKDRKWLDSAQRSVEAAQSVNPDSIRVLLVAGMLNQVAGRYEAALENYRRVQEREPRNTEALRRTAAVYDAMDMPDKAVSAYRKAIQLDPDFYAAYSELGVSYYYRGKYLEAAQAFRETIQRAPGTVQSYINLGAVMSDMGRDAEAEKALMASLRIKETHGALNSMGAIRYYQERYAEAAEFYQNAVGMDGRNFIYQLNLGDAWRRLGKAGAHDAYQRGMELALEELKQNPKRGYTRAFVGYFAARLGDRSRAKDEIEQALQSAPADVKVIRRAVLTYQALGEIEQAFDVMGNATPEVLGELGRHPDLAELRRDARFAQLTGKAGIQNGAR